MLAFVAWYGLDYVRYRLEALKWCAEEGFLQATREGRTIDPKDIPSEPLAIITVDEAEQPVYVKEWVGNDIYFLLGSKIRNVDEFLHELSMMTQEPKAQDDTSGTPEKIGRPAALSKRQRIIYLNERHVRYAGQVIEVTCQQRALLEAIEELRRSRSNQSQFSDREFFQMCGDPVPGTLNTTTHNTLKKRAERLNKRFPDRILTFQHVKWHLLVDIRVAAASSVERQRIRESSRALPTVSCVSCQETFSTFWCQLCRQQVSDRCLDCHMETTHNVVIPQ